MKSRTFCAKCNQVTTQTKEKGQKEWTCLCCESAKFRSKEENQKAKDASKKKPRLNMTW